MINCRVPAFVPRGVACPRSREHAALGRSRHLPQQNLTNSDCLRAQCSVTVPRRICTPPSPGHTWGTVATCREESPRQPRHDREAARQSPPPPPPAKSTGHPKPAPPAPCEPSLIACESSRAPPALTLLAALALTLVPTPFAIAEPIVYQGRFTQNGQVATQTRALRFELFDQPTGGSPLATFESPSVSILSGLFTVPLDFPDASFEGTLRYLQLTVLPVSPGDATQAFSRQLLGTTPRADSVRGLFINQSENVGVGGPATNDRLTIHGTLPLADGQGVRFPDGSSNPPQPKHQRSSPACSTPATHAPEGVL